jgi:hypothetical protein
MPPRKRRATDVVRTHNVTIYIIALLTLTIITIGGIITLLILQIPDTTTVITIIVGIIAPINLALIGLMQQENHTALNSRMDQVIDQTRTISETQGVIAMRMTVPSS